MKKILICTSNGGNGLIAASEALMATAIDISPDTKVVIKDVQNEIGFFPKFLSADLYNYSLRLNVSLASLYVNLGEFTQYSSWGYLFDDRKKIHQLIAKEKPDIIVVTSPWILNSMVDASKWFDVPVYTVVVDIGRFIPGGWVNNGVNKCIVPTQDAYMWLTKKGMNPRTMKIGGLIVHPRYLKSDSNGFDDGRVLLLGGREGCGNIYHTTKDVLKIKEIKRLDVLCGRNISLKKKMERIHDGRLNVYGYVDDMFPFYKHAKIVVSKGGALTVAECIAMQKPLIVDGIHGIMRQEVGNAVFVKQNGIGVVAETSSVIIDSLTKLISDEGYYRSLLKNIVTTKGLINPYKVVGEILN